MENGGSQPSRNGEQPNNDVIGGTAPTILPSAEAAQTGEGPMLPPPELPSFPERAPGAERLPADSQLLAPPFSTDVVDEGLATKADYKPLSSKDMVVKLIKLLN